MKTPRLLLSFALVSPLFASADTYRQTVLDTAEMAHDAETQQLAEQFGEIAEFRSLEGVGHNDIFAHKMEEVRDAMRGELKGAD